MEKKSDDVCDIVTVCKLLDKTIVKQLHLLEEKMILELNIESGINTGTIHLAKSRYIMGHCSVTSSKLPTESSPEFHASTLCGTVQDDGVKQFKVVENDTGYTVNPLHWFGVLVPQDLHKAKSIFQSTINFVVECANVQLKILENIRNMDTLHKYKSQLLKEGVC